MKNLILAFILSVGMIACDKKSSTDGTYKRARAEEEAGNDNLARKAQLMEQDLRRRYRFYSGISHTYLAQFRINERGYRARMVFSPTRHIVDAGRTRTLEEIQDDLDNLFLNIRVSIWDDEGTIGTPGCTFEKVSPDIMSGKLELISAGCPLSYSLRLTTAETPKEQRNEISRLLAEALRNGAQDKIDYIHVSSSSTYNPNGYEFLLERVE